MKGKAGHPPVKEQAKNRKILQEHFDKGHNVLYTARLTKLNRNTVSKYFKEFGESLTEEMDESFLIKQKVSKETCIARMQEYIDMIDKEIKELDLKIVDEDEDEKVWRSQKHYLLVQVTNLIQQKADIEMTPTLDVSLEQMIEERIHEVQPNSPATKKTP